MSTDSWLTNYYKRGDGIVDQDGLRLIAENEFHPDNPRPIPAPIQSLVAEIKSRGGTLTGQTYYFHGGRKFPLPVTK